MNPIFSPPYHPLTFLRTRPYARYMARQYMESVGPSTIPLSTILDDYMRQIQASYNAALAGISLEQRPKAADFLRSELETGMAFGMLYAFGTNIFSIDHALVESFRHTDLDQAPLSALEFPYEAFYVAFPPQQDLLLPGAAAPIDGAYVYVQQNADLRVLHIDLTTRAKPNLTYSDYIVHGDPSCGIVIDLKTDPEKPVVDALTEAFEDAVQTAASSGMNAEMAAKQSLEAAEFGIAVAPTRPEVIQRRIQAAYDGQPVAYQGVQLVLNALCYLTAYPDDSELSWPEGAPDRLKKKADEGKSHKERRNAESKLFSMGVTRVRFCRHPGGGSQGAGGSGESGRSAHWRRGHWRHQPHGPKRQLRKLVWIRPTLVNKEQEPPTDSRIYQVEESSADNSLTDHNAVVHLTGDLK